MATQGNGYPKWLLPMVSAVWTATILAPSSIIPADKAPLATGIMTAVLGLPIAGRIRAKLREGE